MTIDDALFSALTAPGASAAVDAVNIFVRAKMREEGIFHIIFPYIPPGAPWWEIGWSAARVMQSARMRAEQERTIAARTMTRDDWKRRDRRLRGCQRVATLRFDAKLAESARQLARLSALITGDRPWTVA